MLLLQEINEEFQKYRVKLEVLDEIAVYVNDNERSDPSVAAEVKNKLAKLEDPFEEYQARVLQRQAKLQNIVIQGQDFQLSLSEAIDKLKELESEIASLPPLSAKHDTLVHLKEDHEVYYKCVCSTVKPRVYEPRI